MNTIKFERWGVLLLAAVIAITITLVDTSAASAQQCVGNQCNKQASQPAKPTNLIEGWVNVPGGTVWLDPDTTAYEHSTGLVRDLRTGQKFYPIQPQAQSQVRRYQAPERAPVVAPQVAPLHAPPVPAFSPVPATIRPPVVYRPAYQPVVPAMNPYYCPPCNQPQPQRMPTSIDYGPYSKRDNYGATVTGATYNGKWQTVGSLPR